MTNVSTSRPGSAPAVDAARRLETRLDRPSATVPEVGAGEALRLDAGGSLAVLWPTVDAVDYPFVGIVTDGAGYRYPLYLDRETAARHCEGGATVVEASSVPIDPPPHARLAR